MQSFNINRFSGLSSTVLALGPESDGNFCVLRKGNIVYENGFGDLLDEENYKEYKKCLMQYLDDEKIVPDTVISDLHPFFKTTDLGEILAKQYGAKLIQIQHHHAHIFSSVLDNMIHDSSFQLDEFVGIASDGTGYGLDEKIWGGDVFHCTGGTISRIGSLEEQVLIGGDISIREPARMLLSLLLKIDKSNFAWDVLKNYYPKQNFDILIKQYNQEFNCQKTTSTGRVLDAISFLLGFCENSREYKHQPIDLLVRNSGDVLALEPTVFFDKDLNRKVVSTSGLVKFLVENIDENKGRLASTSQLYLAKGFLQLAKGGDCLKIFFSGGMANNAIMKEYLASNDVYVNKKIPSGDKGISVGQLGCYLLNFC
jgi:hydrogenase maturation protein HypF